MTHLRDLERHRHSLAEIRNILNSMKTLAYMETRKLSRFIESQRAVVDSIDEVAADLLSFFPGILPAADGAAPVYLLIGTERGFCGDFNHALPRKLESVLDASAPAPPTVIAVGHKLEVLLENDERISARIEGAGVAEEVPAVLNPLVAELSRLQQLHGLVKVECLYHGMDEDILVRDLLPPFERFRDAPRRDAHPPLLNQPPGDLLLELTEHYLFAALHQVLYTSLMAENHHRIAHLDGAVKHLDHESAELTRRCNALRQEEIVEEIEVILLSAASVGGAPGQWSG